MRRILSLTILVMMVALTVSAQTFEVNPSSSVLKWTGKKVTGEHHGKIKLKSGSFEMNNNKIVNGQFVIDMTSISNEDLQGEWHDKLVGHLKSDDFFSVEKYPEATLTVTGSTKFKNGQAKINGNLTIKGITQPIEFEVVQNKGKFAAVITVDRTLYNVRYGSGKFFDNLGDKTIYDNFTLEVELVTEDETAMK